MKEFKRKVLRFSGSAHSEHNSSYAENVQSQPLQHNTSRLPLEPASNRHFLTIRDLRQARARLFVRGLLTKAESDRIAVRIERFDERRERARKRPERQAAD